MKKNVLVLENEVLIADDLCDTLEDLGYAVFEPALTYQAAINTLDSENVDIAILDIDLGSKKTGMDVAMYIRANHNIPFVYLSSHSDQKTIELAKNTMPYAFLVKPFVSADVLTALEIALNNHAWYASAKLTPSQSEVFDLTPMEKVVVRLIAENKTTKEIADELFISQSTVKNHRHNICVKLELTAGTHSLSKWAIEHKHSLN
ncbi:response regulator transcription factor [Roseivirga pacifica]|uniref:response regulator transcription factor n=1 Tax=Roseivirga pacifica TaxID=1267423 RepID=UPI0020948226|nr:response regulator transcription factor [Roseivirga pacifica]MCO6359005.1 response regulator [Roseivirga pacifica]MCO6365359.1 response regulator [Roseivirga pacifica]MCO6371911.1 response regulator [Roseivirga pacifica]MCO6375978.1 response regulator [Roseivirga pacifica]MCO6379289.1 response regulator [Roseivirga pacifica]